MACVESLHPLLRSAAPTLSRRFFTPIRHQRLFRSTHHCSNSSAFTYQPAFKAQKQTPFLAAFRNQSTTASVGTAKLAANASSAIASSPATPSTLSRIQHGLQVLWNPFPHIGEKSAAEKGKYFPVFTRRIVAYWLFGSAVSVFGIVVFGGLTRLTESGLSITEWKPLTGAIPPFSQFAWEAEFHAYQRTPEFQKLNPHMTLSEFKRIYWMEWTHRLWGRVIAVTFAFPALYFIARRRVSSHVARRLLGIKALIATQGVVGWWMVSSGLKDDLFEKDKTPRVSQYRLSAHLSLAFATYLAMLWTGIGILRERHLGIHTSPRRSVKFLERLSSPRLRVFRWATGATTALVALTAFSGALVAGLDAGLIYNEFPYMGLSLVPPRTELFSTFYSRRQDESDMTWRNMLENPVTVQLDHRVLATTSFTAVNLLGAYGFASPTVRSALTAGARKMLASCVGLVWLQATLGISTLIYMVPTPVAAAHQAGALGLLTGLVVLGSRVWTGRRIWSVVRGRLTNVQRRREKFSARGTAAAGVGGVDG